MGVYPLLVVMRLLGCVKWLPELITESMRWWKMGLRQSFGRKELHFGIGWGGYVKWVQRQWNGYGWVWYAPFHCNFTKWDTSSSYGIESSQSTSSRSTPIPKESFFIPSILHVFPTKRFIFLPVTYPLLQIHSTYLPTDSSYSHPHQPLLTASISPSHPPDPILQTRSPDFTHSRHQPPRPLLL